MNLSLNNKVNNNWIELVGNTPLVVNSLSLDPNSVSRVDAKVTVVDLAANKCAILQIAGLVNTGVSGGVLVGKADPLSFVGDQSLNSFKADFIVSGNNVSVQLQGVPNKTLQVMAQMNLDVVNIRP